MILIIFYYYYHYYYYDYYVYYYNITLHIITLRYSSIISEKAALVSLLLNIIAIVIFIQFGLYYLINYNLDSNRSKAALS